MSIKQLLLVTAGVLSITGCNNVASSQSAQKQNMEKQGGPIAAEILNYSQPIKIKQPTKFSVKVTQDQNVVEDADKVKFEFRAEGQEKGETVMASHDRGGVYVAEKTFNAPGKYTFIPHVDARGFHTMPKKEITVEQ